MVHLLSARHCNVGPNAVTARRSPGPTDRAAEGTGEQILVTCLQCGNVNALGAESLGHEVACGGCGGRLLLNRFTVHELTLSTTPRKIDDRHAHSVKTTSAPPKKVAISNGLGKSRLFIPELLLITYIGVHSAHLAPGSMVLKVLAGVMSVILASYATTSVRRSRSHPLLSLRGWNLTVLILASILQFFHPAWLSGHWLGWVSPVFPLVLGSAAAASVMRLLLRW